MVRGRQAATPRGKSSAKLRELIDLAREHHITCRLARVKPSVMEVLARDGVPEAIGADQIHLDVNEAVMAELESAQHRGP